jgi:hypothetical protein
LLPVTTHTTDNNSQVTAPVEVEEGQLAQAALCR